LIKDKKQCNIIFKKYWWKSSKIYIFWKGNWIWSKGLGCKRVIKETFKMLSSCTKAWWEWKMVKLLCGFLNS
jgi:hypothetical protein